MKQEKAHYIELSVLTGTQLREPAIAWLDVIGYEGFEETPEGLKAYIKADLYDPQAVKNAFSGFDPEAISWTSSEIPPENWNVRWEENYPAVYIDDFCQIISTFHQPKPGFSYTLQIDPKMSFGTGHHQTTRLMVRLLQDIPVVGRQILDMGCGTGILGILAAKMGAKKVLGIDIDPWCYENGRENVQLNQVGEQVEIQMGDARAIPDMNFDIILANINRNVLLQDLSHYVDRMGPDTAICLSGFYQSDELIIRHNARRLGLRWNKSIYEADWTAMHLELEKQNQP